MQADSDLREDTGNSGFCTRPEDVIPDESQFLAVSLPAASPSCQLWRYSASEECTLWRAGPDAVFMDESERPLFLPYIDEYLRSVQGKLLQWNARSLDQVLLCPELIQLSRTKQPSAVPFVQTADADMFCWP